MRKPDRLVIEVFSKPGYVAFYVVGMVIVGFHLWHGAWSMFQSIGLNSPRYNAARKSASTSMRSPRAMHSISGASACS